MSILSFDMSFEVTSPFSETNFLITFKVLKSNNLNEVTEHRFLNYS